MKWNIVTCSCGVTKERQRAIESITFTYFGLFHSLQIDSLKSYFISFFGTLKLYLISLVCIFFMSEYAVHLNTGNSQTVTTLQTGSSFLKTIVVIINFIILIDGIPIFSLPHHIAAGTVRT